ncbi:MAG: filamentous hemagglutinin N-terminal domain-containing protein, partial [Methylococcaceae bacterium]
MKINKQKQSAPPQSVFTAGLPLRRALNLAILAILYPSLASANPDGAQVISGQVSIDTATPGTTTVTNSPNAIINWQNFSIAQNELVQFLQQNGQSAVLNRIIGQNPSEILGQLASNGKVFLINPNGIVFGAGATIDTQGLIASSLNLSDRDFLSGNYHFMAGSSAGNIVNEGIIRAGKDGNIILIAPQIKNNGIIKSDGGSITLAAGQELTITNLDDPDIRFQIQAPTDSVVNLGKLLTEGGAVNVFANSIKHSGDINADSVEVDAQGTVKLVAQQDITLDADSKISANNSQGNAGSVHIESKAGTTLAQGTIEAQATQTGKGGNITVLGEHVGIADKARIDAGGENGGGQILIGGDYQGKNPDIHNAKATYVGKDTTVKADANSNGDGGKVIVWSDQSTRAYGTISAKGGSQSGNGGFIETSGHWLDVEGAKVEASASKGKGGEWLLDPNNVVIQAAGSDTNVSGNPNFTTGNDSAIITTGTIQTALNAGTSVTVTTGTGGTNTQLGDITVNSSIAKTAGSGATLSLSAHNNINLNAAIGSTVGKLNVTLTPNSDAVNGGTANIANTVDLNTGTLTLNGATTLSGTVKNGMLINPGGATLTSSSGTLDGVTLGSNLTESGSLYISNGITLGDGVTVNMGDSSWRFNTTGNQHIATLGSSTINDAGGYLYAGYGVSGQTLLIDSGVTLQGYGNISQSSVATVINNGSILANTAGQTLTV